MKTEGQKLLAKARQDLEWAERMFDESVAPESVDVDRLVAQIVFALSMRRNEALMRVHGTMDVGRSRQRSELMQRLQDLQKQLRERATLYRALGAGEIADEFERLDYAELGPIIEIVDGKR